MFNFCRTFRLRKVFSRRGPKICPKSRIFHCDQTVSRKMPAHLHNKTLKFSSHVNVPIAQMRSENTFKHICCVHIVQMCNDHTHSELQKKMQKCTMLIIFVKKKIGVPLCKCATAHQWSPLVSLSSALGLSTLCLGRPTMEMKPPQKMPGLSKNVIFKEHQKFFKKNLKKPKKKHLNNHSGKFFENSSRK